MISGVDEINLAKMLVRLSNGGNAYHTVTKYPILSGFGVRPYPVA